MNRRFVIVAGLIFLSCAAWTSSCGVPVLLGVTDAKLWGDTVSVLTGIIVVLGGIVLVGGVLLVFLWSLACTWLDRRRNPRPGSCLKCDYNVTGNVSGICPECGSPIPPECPPATRRDAGASPSDEKQE